MDDISHFNRERWNDLARSEVVFSRPWLDLTPEKARQRVDPHGFIGSYAGKNVLCLAAGGGQQSVAFAMLGAQTTVFDLSDEMLARDRQAAEALGLTIRVEQGDMRDLSRFTNASFDVVWHGYSLNFVPSVDPVLDEVSRVLRPGGGYHTEFHNPFVHGVDERDWDGKAYPINTPYLEGVESENLTWEIADDTGQPVVIEGPREFRRTFSSVLNGLSERGFILLGLWEELSPDPKAEPGTWDHFMAFCPPWFHLWMSYQPDLMKRLRAGQQA